MIQQMTNRELAQEINARIGNAPIPFDSVYSIALQIYQELGGEENDFDSVYSILLEILPLAESVAKKTSITDIDELPDAKDNNNNIYRLNSNDKVYMSVRYPDTMTNRLPDEQQINKACLKDSDNKPNYYKGTYKVICSDGEINGYGWYSYDGEYWYMYISDVNAEHITENETVYTLGDEELTLVLNQENKTITASDYTIAELQADWRNVLKDMNLYPIPAIYNAPEEYCIGNATCEDNQYSMTATYTGEEVEYTDEDTHEHCIGYKWTINEEGSGYDYMVTSKKASEIYYTTVEGAGIYTDTITRCVANGVGEYTDFETLYIPQLNAPESEQIGKAEIGNNQYQIDNYSGERTVTCSDGNVTVYLWGSTDTPTDVGNAALTKIPASDIYTASVGAVYQGLAGMHWNDISTLTYDDTIQAFNDDFNHYTENIPVLNGGILKYQRAIENWEWKQIPTMDDIPQPTTIKLESTSKTELAKLNDFTETGVYNDINLQVKYNNRYCPATLEVLKEGEAIYQYITFSDLTGYGSRYLISRGFYQEWQDGYLKVLDETISIANTGNTYMAKLDNFTETGVYNNIHLIFLGKPATLIVHRFTKSNQTNIMQYIKYWDGDNIYGEYAWTRLKMGSAAWDNNPGGESPIKLFDLS